MRVAWRDVYKRTKSANTLRLRTHKQTKQHHKNRFSKNISSAGRILWICPHGNKKKIIAYQYSSEWVCMWALTKRILSLWVCARPLVFVHARSSYTQKCNQWIYMQKSKPFTLLWAVQVCLCAAKSEYNVWTLTYRRRLVFLCCFFWTQTYKTHCNARTSTTRLWVFNHANCLAAIISHTVKSNWPRRHNAIATLATNSIAVYCLFIIYEWI